MAVPQLVPHLRNIEHKNQCIEQSDNNNFWLLFEEENDRVGKRVKFAAPHWQVI